MEQVREAHHTSDIDKSKALWAELFKLLGNSGYVKLIEAVEWQTYIIYTKDEKVAAQLLLPVSDLESRKQQITFNRLLQIRIAVYQLAKQRLFEYHYDFLDWYFDQHDLIQLSWFRRPWTATTPPSLLIGFRTLFAQSCNSSFKLVDFQPPDWSVALLVRPLKLAGW